MTDKPSREDVLRVAGEPVAVAHVGNGRFVVTVKWDQLKLIGFNLDVEKDVPLYTEAQALAMYAAGAEGMRERADKDAARYRWLRDGDYQPMSLREQFGHDIDSGDIDKDIDEAMAKHYPVEFGPSDDKRISCSCGNPDPNHIRALPITPTNTEGEQG